MATSQRLLGFAIFGLLVAALVAVVVKGSDETPLTLEPTPSPTEPTPSETFTFPGPLPTETELFPTETETAAGPEVSPGDELPRTGGRSVVWAALLTLAIAAGGGVLVRRAARSGAH